MHSAEVWVGQRVANVVDGGPPGVVERVGYDGLGAFVDVRCPSVKRLRRYHPAELAPYISKNPIKRMWHAFLMWLPDDFLGGDL